MKIRLYFQIWNLTFDVHLQYQIPFLFSKHSFETDFAKMQNIKWADHYPFRKLYEGRNMEIFYSPLYMK